MTDARNAVGAPEGCSFVTVKGVQLAYSDTGAGMPLVCLHATGHGARDFANLPDLLSRQVRVIAVDWPGHGRSSDDTVPASASRYEALLEGFLDELNIGQAILLGNSIGGAASLAFAAENPDRVAGLILANPGGLLPINGLTRAFCGMMESFFRAGVKKRRWFRYAFSAYYRTVLRTGPIAAHRGRIVAAGYDQARVLAEAWHSFAQPDADLRVLCTAIASPVLVTWARHDKVIQHRQCRPAIDTIPDVETILFNGGHCAFLEDAAAFGRAADSFLEGLDISPKQ